MATAFANFQQKMNSLRIEADENAAKAEELKAKVKTLEQENLQKEQEITSLTHRNGLLETEVEKLETAIKEAKAAAGEASEHSNLNENLQRKLQLLEEEAETADKTLRDTNEK
jgi:tropomyosin